MYKVLGKGERIVGMASITFALVYRVLADYAKIYIPDVIVFIVLLAAFGYLFFNRVVKLVIDAVKMRNKCFDTFLTIEEIQTSGAVTMYSPQAISTPKTSSATRSCTRRSA